MKRILLIHSLLLFAVQLLIAQSEMKLSKDSLCMDLDFAYNKICEIHPDPFMRISQDSVSRIKDNICSVISDNETIGTFYFKVALLIATIKDGHTTVLQPQFISSQNLRHGNKIFPIDVKIKENKLYAVYDNFRKDSVNKEIISINNIPADSIMNPIFNAKSFDKYPDINYKSIERDFFILLNELCGSDSIYKIELKGRTEPYLTHGLNYDNLMKSSRYTDKSEPYLLSIKNNTAIAKFANFIPNNELYQFIDSVFQIIVFKAVDTLLIDVRGNTGGSSDIISKIIKHLTPDDFKIYDLAQIKINSYVKERYEKRDTNLFNTISILENGSIYDLIPEHEKEKSDNIYNGKVIVLTDYSTFSAGSTFAHLVKNMELGKVLGDTGCYDIYFGEFVFLNLPYSKLSFTVSTKKLYEWRSENPKKSRN
jgi:hypothetical protein